MNQEQVLKLCTNLVDLNKDPQPGLMTWNEACTRTVEELRQALNEDDDAIDNLYVTDNENEKLHTLVSQARLVMSAAREKDTKVAAKNLTLALEVFESLIDQAIEEGVIT